MTRSVWVFAALLVSIAGMIICSGKLTERRPHDATRSARWHIEAVLYTPRPPRGTTYFVSNGGDDAAKGTSEDAAWRTIARLLAADLAAGDTVQFERGGVWREQLTIPSSGSPGKPITFGAYGTGAKPVMNGADVQTGWKSAGSSRWYIDNPNPVTTRAVVVVDGVLFAEQRALAAVDAAGEFFIDLSTKPDRLYVFSNVDPSTLTAEVSAREYGFVTLESATRHHLVVDSLRFVYAGRGGLMFHGPGENPTREAHDGASRVTNCEAYANNLFGFAAVNHFNNVLFEDCLATFNGNNAYAWYADGITFRRVYTSDGLPKAVTFTDGHGIGLYRSDDCTIEYCESHRDADAYNLAHDAWPVTNTVRYNKVYNSKAGTPGITVGRMAAGGAAHIYYNLIVNGGNASFITFEEQLGTVNFYNNTLYNRAGTGTEGTGTFANANRCNIRNNVIVKAYVESEANFIVLGGSPATLDNNLYYVTNGGFRNYYGAPQTTLEAWKAATGKDAHAISADPMFVDIDSNWQLRETSPCIDAGVPVGLTHDIEGNPIVGDPDVGAFEYANRK